MNKRIVALILSLMAMLAVALGMIGCDLLNPNKGCEHEWVEATCTTPKTCKLCNATEGEPNGHIGGKATCTAKAECIICGAEYGELAEHTLVAATCTEAEYCSVCKAEFGYKLGHYSSNITSCSDTVACDRCGVGYIPGHTIKAATCTEPATCTRPGCGYTTGDPLGHKWADATCTKPETCTVCQTTQGSALGHTWADATCTKPETCTVCQATQGSALGHTWADATCTEPKTCTVCNATEGEPLGHVLDAGVVVPPTCTEEGYIIFTCTVCHEETRSGKEEHITPALGHDLIYHAAKAPTCTEIGWSAYYTCSRCDYSTYQERAAIGHYMIGVAEQAPTCTEIGWEAYTKCARFGCTHTEGYTELPALGHRLENVLEKAPTCTEPGYTAHQACAFCDYTTPHFDVAPLGHDWGDWVSNGDGTHKRTCANQLDGELCTQTVSCHGPEATCTVPSICEDCGFEIAPVKPHNPGPAPTCTEAQYCLDCNALLADALGHRLENVIALAPTCTEPGYSAHQFCAFCDYVTPYFDIAPLGHDMLPATCTEPSKCAREDCTHTVGNALDHAWGGWVSNGDGTHTQECANDPSHKVTLHCSSDDEVQCGVDVVCDVCGYVIEEAPEHEHEAVVTPPTCLDDGYTTYTCTVCGDSYVADIVTTPGHSYEVVITPPTCLDGGYTTHTCQECGDSYVDTLTDALGHDWSEWTAADGTHKRVCQNDNTHEESGACSGAHATCESAQICDVCNNVMTPALGHDWSEWTTENGTHSRVCHNDPTHEESGACYGAPATCENNQVCEICADVMALATGHKWGDWNSNGDGTHTRLCANDITHTQTENCAGHKATCTSPAFCTGCNTYFGKAIGHTYDNTCDDVCNVCANVRTIHLHPDTNDDHVCDVCGIDIPKEPLSPVAKAAITLACLAVLGGGGFACYWFIFKKKLMSIK